ncbi:hypothetical protein PtA15_10A734 [Puccinia triticina]|uniref:Uncharacterized protein n=1 Tax=Puccinia triticina TaxID=208348 RepID=A0ABY7CXD7_9BASI|nr:uncharacterized protein PtA15_10A734 [Puccinia triticina]WAQ89310.1 hypothetical protein PtA15_10A734 [Puccinia triticina]
MTLPSPKNPSPDNTPKLQDTVTPSNHGTPPPSSDQTAPPSQPAPDVSSGQPAESTLKDVQHFLDKQHQHSEIPAGDQGQTNAPADPLLDPSSVPPPNPLSEPVPPKQEPTTSIPTSLLPSPHPPSQTPGVPSASTSSLPHGNQPPQTPSDVPPQPTTSSESATEYVAGLLVVFANT